MPEFANNPRTPNGDRGARTRRKSVIALGAGRRIKYLVLAFWLIAAVAAAGFAGKLQSVERNDLVSSLPVSAESTQVVKIQSSGPAARRRGLAAGQATRVERAATA